MKSSFEKLDKAMSIFPEGNYNSRSRSKALKIIQDHGWTEEEYIDACTDRFEDAED